MAVRPVSRLPAPVLKQTAEPVGAAPNDELAADLVDTMRASPACVGLAAPQIGVSRRAFALDVSAHPKTTVSHGLVVLFDPVIVESSGRKIAREGCMSVPDLTADVARATSIVVVGTSPEGERKVIATEGFEARAFQHEIDHLDGLLILDRVASLTTDVFRRKVYR
ncbi:MAG TPA: peptide deformylase [Actinomycetota bacterium]|nr:peptide deformylase [Actinomycetota bacterium]